MMVVGNCRRERDSNIIEMSIPELLFLCTNCLSVDLPKSAASSKAFILYQWVGTVEPSAMEKCSTNHKVTPQNLGIR